MKVLFVCNQGRHRSKTAENLFKGKFETKSAGLYCANPVSEQQLSWADVVAVMEDKQRTELSKRFPRQYMMKRIVSLNVPDCYKCGDPDLIEVLKSKADKLL